MAKLAKEYPLYRFKGQLIPVKKYARKGKPAAGDEPDIVGYTLDLVLERNEEAVSKLLNKKGRFILATNDMDAESYPAARMLEEYKAQQGVERGFRFLKDPWFMVDSVFLISPRRIEALMMVMTLCLLVYNVAQYLGRQMHRLVKRLYRLLLLHQRNQSKPAAAIRAHHLLTKPLGSGPPQQFKPRDVTAAAWFQFRFRNAC